MEWKDLWQQNYRGVGDTNDLEKYLKKLGYGSRTNISYLPWAVVERIFRLQGGEVELFRPNEKSSVEADITETGSDVDSETGVVTTKYVRSYFLNIQASWQGRLYTERYPLQDSNGKPLTFWTQNDLNKAYQRGKVKAIAIVSGIGYKLFEDGDLQFEDEPSTDLYKREESVQPKEPKQKPIKQTAPVKEIVEKEVSIIEEVKEKTFDRTDYENDIKQSFIAGGTSKSNIIKDFLKENKTIKVSDLTDELLIQLHSQVVL
jgi:translation initiation factor 1 (eIF-1/SUI1)